MSTSPPPPTFTPLTRSTSLHTPRTYTPNQPLILLLTWNAAPPRPLQKYTTTYHTLFPSARILLIQCSTADIIFRSSAAHARDLGPALEVVRAHVDGGRGGVLVHLFSNGGGVRGVEVMRAWRDAGGLGRGGEEGERGGREGEEEEEGKEKTLPIRAMILDSSPGKGDWMRSHAAITASLPRATTLHRLVFGAVVHVFLAMVFLVNALTRREQVMRKMWRELNDVTLFSPTVPIATARSSAAGGTEKRKVPRVYLYSKADEMVGWEEVEEHADAAERAGWDVTKVRFERSGHCAHVREDAERYWGEVVRAWERGGG